ncbi:hypothetical protein [Candidatus Symbiopectobacterium sp.]|uniref:hypothetical protein n=1 Tax=Candidatus Symbiopectobacterium sp. TaxID=2816440 RepID=UPI0025BF3A53|nr:hypothetical protein [Candidatus Symbiopectobacterium sp.]
MNILDFDARGIETIKNQPGGIQIKDIGPAFVDWNAPPDLINGAFRGLNNVDYTVEKNLADAFRPLTAAAGLDKSWDERIENIARIGETSKPDPLTTSTVGQLLDGFGEVIAPAAVGSALGGPIGAAGLNGVATTQVRYDEALKKGVDDNTAFGKAILEGGVNAVGVVIPAAPFAKSLSTRLLAGAASNAGLGVAHRAATHELLERNGYKEMAQQYRAFDKTVLATDVILGAAFGGLAHLYARPSPEIVDAAMTARGAEHFSESTAPGLPVDIESSVVHQNALDLAMRQLDAGERVDVSSLDGVNDAAFLLHNESTVSAETIRLRGLADQLLTRGERKELQQDIHNLEYSISQLETSKAEISGLRTGNSRSARIKRNELEQIDSQIAPLADELAVKKDTLLNNIKGGINFEAKADLSRLEQGIVPAYLRLMLRDEAGITERMQERPPIADISSLQDSRAPRAQENTSGAGSGKYPPSVERLRALVLANPEAKVISAFDNEGTPLQQNVTEVMADIDANLQTARRESTMFDTAVSCFLRRG